MISSTRNIIIHQSKLQLFFFSPFSLSDCHKLRIFSEATMETHEGEEPPPKSPHPRWLVHEVDVAWHRGRSNACVALNNYDTFTGAVRRESFPSIHVTSYPVIDIAVQSRRGPTTGRWRYRYDSVCLAHTNHVIYGKFLVECRVVCTSCQLPRRQQVIACTNFRLG